jgi:hypothetical protein
MGKFVGVGVGIIWLAFLAGPSPVRASDEAAGEEFFEKRIRPIFVEICYQCHAGEKKKGNLQLDSREKLLRGGDNGAAIVPGEPEKSLLIKAIRYTDEDLRMPPKSKLSERQIADLTTWVRQGAPWPRQLGLAAKTAKAQAFDLQERRKHWAWQPPKAYIPPAVARTSWPQSPIDCFILAKLEANGLAPAEPADRRTLIRRVTYDLIGLPPTAAEIDAFLADPAPDAFAKVVDRLLSSEHYGERWARHWLDLVRFAETCGHEFDFELPDAYAYRDYVIRALNADVPYDQLVREHVAGDLLPAPRRHPTEKFNESILGTGFWFLGEARHSPVDVAEDEADHIDNQIDVLGKTFLGLTLACARCHDHKFDAISTRDYYALAGYLESSRQQRAFLDEPERNRQIIRRLRELHEQTRTVGIALTAPAIEARAANLAQILTERLDQGFGKLSLEHPLYPWTLLTSGAPQPRRFAARRREVLDLLQARFVEADLREKRYETSADSKKGHRWFVTGDAFTNGRVLAPDVVLRSDPLRPVQSVVRPGIIHTGLVSNHLQGVSRSQTFVLSKKRIHYHVGGKQAQVNLIIDGYQLIRDPIYGGLSFKIDSGEHLEWRVQDVSMWQGHRAYIEILDDGPGYVVLDRILSSDDDGPPPDAPNRLLLRLLDDPAITSPLALARKYQELCLEIVSQWRSGSLGSASDLADRTAILNFMLQSELFAGPPHGARERHADQEKLSSLLREREHLEAALPAPRRGLAMVDGTAWNERVHIRGNHKTLGEAVPRRFLEALSGVRPPPAQGSGRLLLADQMVGPSNPLLARVMVNRIWLHHFGEGIVRSVDNFGVLGERPTHPELLDYLAAEFVQSGWSFKKMHRLMLLSSTYQMSSRAAEAAELRDPDNKLWHRMPIRRLEAESIRDAMLAVSGRLDPKLYGPSVPPYLTPHMAGRGRPDHSGPLDGLGRRSIYLSVRRNFLTPMFLAFDYPIPFTTMGRRSVSNVPAQALALMNNPLVVQQAELWARRILAEPATAPAQRVCRMYVDAFGRPPTAVELAEALAFLEEQGRNNGGAVNDHRAWADLGHVLFNVKEFIFLN